MKLVTDLTQIPPTTRAPTLGVAEKTQTIISTIWELLADADISANQKLQLAIPLLEKLEEQLD